MSRTQKRLHRAATACAASSGVAMAKSRSPLVAAGAASRSFPLRPAHDPVLPENTPTGSGPLPALTELREVQPQQLA